MVVLILGMGMSGQAALRKLIRQGHREFILADRYIQSLALPIDGEGLKIAYLPDQPTSQSQELTRVKQAVISPGVGPDSPLYQQILKLGIPFIGELELGLHDLEGYKALVTGSHGKSTLVTLMGHMVGGIDHTGGNIGRPVCDLLGSSGADIWVIEASSYQLESLNMADCQLGVVLPITPNHLDRHGSYEAYEAAKGHIIRALGAEGELWIEQAHWERWKRIWGDRRRVDHWGGGRLLTRWGEREKFLELVATATLGRQGPLLRNLVEQDLEKVEIAIAFARLQQIPLEDAWDRLKTYEKLPHRLQLLPLRTVDRGRYRWVCQFVDDSKSTSVGATLHALNHLRGPAILIVGGRHKGADYLLWKEPIQRQVIALITLGEAGARIASQLAGNCLVKQATDLAQAMTLVREVLLAYEAQRVSELLGTQTLRVTAEPLFTVTVLLSPGCSSLDQFASFEERGKKFCEYVTTLSL